MAHEREGEGRGDAAVVRCALVRSAQEADRLRGVEVRTGEDEATPQIEIERAGVRRSLARRSDLLGCEHLGELGGGGVADGEEVGRRTIEPLRPELEAVRDGDET